MYGVAAPPHGPPCSICGNFINGTMVGFGDGSGNNFVHEGCYRGSIPKMEVFEFERKISRSGQSSREEWPWLYDAPRVSWQNRLLDWWRNW